MKSFQWYSGVLVFLFISAFSTFSSSLDSPLPTQDQSGKIEIVIRNSKYEFQGGVLKPNKASIIILRNMDNIQHGFNSTFLQEFDLKVETDVAAIYGKGIKGIHINPGAIARFSFIPTRPGTFTFQCDLHPSMKGEMLVFSVEAV